MVTFQYDTERLEMSVCDNDDFEFIGHRSKKIDLWDFSCDTRNGFDARLMG